MSDDTTGIACDQGTPLTPEQLAEITQALKEADAGDFATPGEMEAVSIKYKP